MFELQLIIISQQLELGSLWDSLIRFQTEILGYQPQSLFHNIISPMRTLCVFDMDHTLCNDYLEQSFLLQVPPHDYDHHLEEYRQRKIKWPTLVTNLIGKYPPVLATVEEYLKGCQMVPHMKSVLEMLEAKGHRIILVSGANQFCITNFIKNHDLEKYFHRTLCPQVTYHHQQQTFSYSTQILECNKPICTHGFCKGETLKAYLADHPHQKILYFGDGANDLCGVHEINEGVAFVRRGFGLEKHIKDEESGYGQYVKCEVIYWDDGSDLRDQLHRIHGEDEKSSKQV